MGDCYRSCYGDVLLQHIDGFRQRRYSSGYYVNLGGKHNGVKQKETELSFAKKAKAAKHVNATQTLPQTETVAPTVASSEVAAPAPADNTLTASIDATPVVLDTRANFTTSHVNFPMSKPNQTFVAANNSAKKDATSSSNSNNHKGWFIFGGIAAFFGALGLHGLASKRKGGDKSWIVTLILCWLLGGLGIHRFYLGYTWQGVVQLLTGGGCGVWVLIDFIRILMKTLKPIDGDYAS